MQHHLREPSGNERDLEFVRGVVPDGSRWLVDSLPALNTREAIIIGDGVSVPMHIRFDDLPPERRPASTTPSFSARWQDDAVGVDLLDDTIRRWRQQIRGSDLAAEPAAPSEPAAEARGEPGAAPDADGRSDSLGPADAAISIRKTPVEPAPGPDNHGIRLCAPAELAPAPAVDAAPPPEPAEAVGRLSGSSLRRRFAGRLG